MLELVNVTVNKTAVSPQFLMDILDTMERLNDTSEVISQDELQVMHKDLTATVQQSEKELVRLFREKNYDKAKESVARMNYYVRMLENVYARLDVFNHLNKKS